PPFSELLGQARSAPRLAESRSEVDQAQGLAQQAAARPNPSVSVLVENFGGPRPYDQLGGQTTFQIDQPFELGGKRAARIAAGRAGVDAARARFTLSVADFAFDLASAYAEAEAAERRLDLAQVMLGLAEDDARVAGALVKAGKEADLRAVQAMTAVQAARAGMEAARSAKEAAFGRLTALAGASAPLTAIPVSLLAHADRPETPPVPEPMASPAYRAAEAARAAAARTVQAERARAAPDVTVSVGVRRLGGEGATAVVGGLSVPFPIFDRNRGDIAAARAALAGAEARLNAARLDAETESRSSVARARAALARIAAAREGEGVAEEAYRLSRIGYEGGKLPLIELLNARRALAEARAQTLDARLERLGAEAALARLQGAAPFGDQP
ncbi:MAG: TolC family protein, partial [Caulobacteraceae bacterium]|nr:TolC family protein [Caulobacteraceae bacterium]